MDERMNISELLRLAADDELSDDQRAVLESHLRAHPEDRARVEFERGLREACARVLQGGAPAGLRARIVRAIEAREDAGAGASVAGRIDSAPTVVVRGSVRMTLVHRVLNVAALIVVAALAALFVRAVFTGDQTEAVASFLEKEHRACRVDVDRLTGRELAVTDLSAVPEVFRGLLGTAPSIPDIERLGYRFEGAGECAVPGGDSVHLLFVDKSGDAEKALSLFIQRTDRFKVDPGKAYSVATNGDEATIIAWGSEGLVYYLVARDPSGVEAMQPLLPLTGPLLKLKPMKQP